MSEVKTIDIEKMVDTIKTEVLGKNGEELAGQLTDDIKVHFKEYIESFTNDFIKLESDILDHDEMTRMLSLFYLELKCRWNIFNTRIQYQMLLQGVNDELLGYKASITSLVLEKLEALFTEERIAAIHDFIGEPMTSENLDPVIAEPKISLRMKTNEVEIEGISKIVIKKTEK